VRYAKSRPDTKDMRTVLYSRCLGANATIVGMQKHPTEFEHIRALIALQPANWRTLRRAPIWDFFNNIGAKQTFTFITQASLSLCA